MGSCLDKLRGRPPPPPPDPSKKRQGLNGTHGGNEVIYTPQSECDSGEDNYAYDREPGRKDIDRDDVTYRAMYDFEPVEKSDLKLVRGDELQIIDRYVPNAEGWWMARNLRTGFTGAIPSNFVTPIPQDGHAGANKVCDFSHELWWFDIGRSGANRLLILPANPLGTFLVRDSKADMYTLSVRNFDNFSAEIDLKHYHIKFDSATSEHYITRRNKFRSLSDLVNHYQGDDADGLCCQLTQPCPREPQSIPFKAMEIMRSDIKLMTKLGEGKFGEVWRGTYKNKVNVAVKKMKPGTMDREDFLTEARTMHGVYHHRLVQLMGVVTKGEPILIIIELVEHGSLLKYLREDKGKFIAFKDLLDIATQIAEGMAYLEQKNYIHRDLRADNILIGTGNRIKIADFGLAKVLLGEMYELGEETKFPVRWTAPEAVMEHKFTIKSDVWSYGVLLYELVTYGRQPYAGMGGMELMERLNDNYRLPNPEHKNHKFIQCPPKMYDMMLMCWSYTPEDRPTFEYLKTFFDDYYIETEDSYKPEEID